MMLPSSFFVAICAVCLRIQGGLWGLIVSEKPNLVASHNKLYLDFSPFSRSLYVIDIYISKKQRLSFPRKICASHYTHQCSQADRTYRKHKELGSSTLPSSSSTM